MTPEIKENKVSRNTIFLTIAYTLQKVISFGYFIYYARYIGYIGTGKFVFAVSFATIFGIIVDLGLSPVLIREIARRKDRAKVYFNSVFTVKVFFAIIGLLLIFISINSLNYPDATKNLVYLAGLVMVLESFSLSFYGVFRGYQNLKYEAIGTIIYQFLVITTGVIGLKFTHNPLILGVAILIGAFGNFLYALYNLIKKAGILPKINFNFDILRFLVKIAVPFLLAGIFIKIYAYIDILLLSFLKGAELGDQYVGWYSVAYKLTFALQFIPLAFNNSIYPALSAIYYQSRDLLARQLENAFHYLTIISLPISLGVFALGDKITILFTDEYSNSVPALRILILSLMFIFINFILGSILNACNRQKLNTINIGLTVLFNIIANLILIPILNHIGAAISALLSAIFLFILDLYQTNKIVKYDKVLIVERFFKTFFAAFIMGTALFLLKDEVYFLLLIPLGAIFYVSLLFLIKVITKQDIAALFNSIKKR